jgi:uncharacterized protein YkuJ
MTWKHLLFVLLCVFGNSFGFFFFFERSLLQQREGKVIDNNDGDEQSEKESDGVVRAKVRYPQAGRLREIKKKKNRKKSPFHTLTIKERS